SSRAFFQPPSGGRVGAERWCAQGGSIGLPPNSVFTANAWMMNFVHGLRPFPGASCSAVVTSCSMLFSGHWRTVLFRTKEAKMIFRKLPLCLLTVLIVPAIAEAQLVVNGGQTANALVQNVLLGGGVAVSNITFNGQPGNAVFEQLATFNSANANVGIGTGVLLATGGAQVAIGPNDSEMASVPIATSYSDPDLQSLAGGSE